MIDDAILDKPPYFVGQGASSLRHWRKRNPAGESENHLLSSTPSYMTAPEMQSKVVSLTGFFHPAFDTYADVLGRYDPSTSIRTNDRPSLISILCIQTISTSIADAVVDREDFLEDEERFVFKQIDLRTSPNDGKLKKWISDLYRNWLDMEASTPVLERLSGGYRSIEKAKNSQRGYKWLLSMLLSHGGLYYY